MILKKWMLLFSCVILPTICYAEGIMKISSPAFDQGKSIPKKYTCEGENISPPLTLENLPNNTKSIALVVEDPDAPIGTVNHWIAWNIPPNTTSIEEGAKLTYQGQNQRNKAEYMGPCPPPGATHRYFFKVYALDKILDLEKGSTRVQLEQTMKGHEIGKAEFFGVFHR